MQLTSPPSTNFSEGALVLQPNKTSAIIVCSIVVLLYVIAVLGDGMLISAFVKDLKMRTTTNMLVISHLTAEFISSILGIATHISTIITHGESSGSTVWCTLASSVFNSCLGAGLMSLVGISVDRYLAVVKKVHHKVTRARVQAYLVVIWTLSIVYGIPLDLILNDRLRWQYVAWLLVNCKGSFLIDKELKPWTMADIFRGLLLLFCGLLPLLVMAYTSFHIFRTALKGKQRVHAIRAINNDIAAGYTKSAFTTIIIISIYFLCLIPTTTLTVVCEKRSTKCSMPLYFLSKLTLCFRSACFPVIYAVRKRNCSEYLRQLLYFRKGNVSTNYLITFRGRNVQRSSEKTARYSFPATPEINVCKREMASSKGARGEHTELAFVDLIKISSEMGQGN